MGGCKRKLNSSLTASAFNWRISYSPEYRNEDSMV